MFSKVEQEMISFTAEREMIHMYLAEITVPILSATAKGYQLLSLPTIQSCLILKYILSAMMLLSALRILGTS